jgi:hypothetical protein
MFKIPRVNVIESDEGFSIEVLGRMGLKYIQKGRSLFINSELSAAPHDMLIFAMSIKKWDSGEPIDENTKGTIIDNILRAFAWRGIKPDIKYRNQIFSKPLPNTIESDEGFSVELLGQTQLKYTQNGKSIFIDTEKLVETNTVTIKAKSIKNWDSGEPIDAKTESLILNNIGLALDWDGAKIIINLHD